jgi:predicted lipoprotein with Yx(FWY)xxD motif
MTRSRPHTILSGTAAAMLVAIAVAGCGGSGSGSGNAASAPSKTANGHAATVALANTGLGKVLVNSQGRTLYLFRADHGTKSACGGACAKAWPPLRATSKPSVGTGLQSSVVGTAKRTDGNSQVTYHGHPLYTYIGDQKAGATSGQGVNAFGGGWFALTSSGAQASGSAPGSGSGTGY